MIVVLYIVMVMLIVLLLFKFIRIGGFIIFKYERKILNLKKRNIFFLRKDIKLWFWVICGYLEN